MYDIDKYLILDNKLIPTFWVVSLVTLQKRNTLFWYYYLLGVHLHFTFGFHPTQDDQPHSWCTNRLKVVYE